MNYIVQHGSREFRGDEAKALVLEVSRRMAHKRMQRRYDRIDSLPRERHSIEKAALAVEEKLVRALWVIERSTIADRPKGHEGRNGLDYAHDHSDTHARYQDAPGGKYDTAPPRSSPPESKAITEARIIHTKWLAYLDERSAKVLNAGALSKRGDPARRVSWERVKVRKELGGYSVRTLQGIYSAALRTIVAALTTERIG